MVETCRVVVLWNVDGGARRVVVVVWNVDAARGGAKIR